MHVIIAGAARSGKTTLSLMLNKYGYTHYKMDSIKRGICESYELKYDDWKDISPIMCRIINRVIDSRGIEIGKHNIIEVINSVTDYIEKIAQEGDPDKFIHCI